ncbi:hypothetical protein Glove_23g159 [Diversispora epigaea]|uniref:Uncharacterized protein n=1 Tax=Diversispora epigaea TaxID=1348612 RepID=A0A397JL27_9GLOM|nr:hypothetical protein Glove_23g159 [Diversispora epigaea]
MEDIENINADKDNFYIPKDTKFDTWNEVENYFDEYGNIPKDTKFDTWNEVENYFDEYGSRNGFAIVKNGIKRDTTKH